MRIDDIPPDFVTFCRMAKMSDEKISESWQEIWEKTLKSETFRLTLEQNLKNFYTAIKNTLPVDSQTLVDDYFK